MKISTEAKCFRAFLLICGVYALLTVAMLVALLGGNTDTVLLAAPFSLMLQLALTAFEIGQTGMGLFAIAADLMLWLAIGASAVIAVKKDRKWALLPYVILGLDIALNLFLLNLLGLVGEVLLIVLLKQAVRKEE